jgi:hypothetical protein
MKEVSLLVTHACTLKCRLCVSGSPYIHIPPYTCQDLVNVIDTYFRISEPIDRFSLSGGEPFLYKDLPELVHAVMRYKKYFGELRIITNGTLPVPSVLQQVIKEYRDKINILVDDYGPALSVNVGAISDTLDDLGIVYQIRKYYGENPYANGWVKFGEKTKLRNSGEEIKDIFKRCIAHANGRTCFNIWGGTINFCSYIPLLVHYGILNKKSIGCIDLLDSNVSDENKRQRLKAFHDIAYADACAYCNGFDENSIRYKPAEQII